MTKQTTEVNIVLRF